MGALDGLTVVVTGGGSGLGAAYSRLASSEGAIVIINDLNLVGAHEVAADCPGAIVDGSDISTWDGAATLVRSCIDQFGRIDGLVNNAGVIEISAPEDATESQLRKVVGVNLLGTAFCGVHALKHMLARGSGSIVNVTSGAQLGMPLVAGYSASKGGVTSLTYSWAAAVEGTDVRVNAVSPDAATPLAAEVARQNPNVAPGVSTPESNAAAVVFLLSAEGSGINGEVILTGGERMSRLIRPVPMRPAARRSAWDLAAVREVLLDEWELGSRGLPT